MGSAGYGFNPSIVERCRVNLTVQGKRRCGGFQAAKSADMSRTSTISPLRLFFARGIWEGVSQKAVAINARACLLFWEMGMKNLIWIVLAVIVLGGGYMLFTGKSVDEVVNDVSGATQQDVEAPEALEDAAEAAGETADAAADAAGDAVDAAQDTATEAAEAVEEAASEATSEASDAVEGAVEAAEETANEASEAAQEAAQEAVDATTGTADEATDAAGDATEAATDSAEEAVDATTEAASDAAAETEAASQEAVDAASETANEAESAVEGAADGATEATEEAATGAGETTTGDAAAGGAEQAPEALTVDGFDMERVRSLIEGSDLGSMQENLLIEGIRAAQDNPELLQSALQAARQALGY
ncbi:hypothetical protein ROTO_15150 [Roseovarius tolerans]|uniref:Methyl-accepting transducer domain-containing protein n=2 Tax=Roseovarius tolerans TaxID=74031 RepID=A0A0L6CWR0_9RHOB|nr:hypothetical protein ROTO_15150 [Roseovarius tolerans]